MKHESNNTFYPSVGWTFYDDEAPYPSIENLQDGIANVPEDVMKDIEQLLQILADQEVLFPTYFELDRKYTIEADSVSTFCMKMWEIMREHGNILSLEQIGGWGVVYDLNEKKERIEDLVTINDIRFCERHFRINTSKSYWLPLTMNLQEEQIWQPHLKKLNGNRITNALKQINNNFNISVEPAVEEIDKENFIWIKDFELFVAPEILQDFIRLNPNISNLEIEQFRITS